jgi:pilus assembly protein CpaE
VIVDTFPMFDGVVVATLDLSDRAYIVMENVVPTLLGAVSLLDVLERIGFPAERQSLIINRHQHIAGSLALPDVAARLGRQIDHVLPYDKRVIEAANTGEPIGAKPPSFGFGGFSRSLRRLVDEVESLDGRRSLRERSVNGVAAGEVTALNGEPIAERAATSERTPPLEYAP